jgi:L-ascorbate metabolism protein UlaG (beta-lactamase superfamily)
MKAIGVLAAVTLLGCMNPTRAFGPLLSSSRPPPAHAPDPAFSDARLAVLWIGHATALVQLDDKFVLTDPVLTRTVGQLSARLYEPGLAPDRIPPLDVVLVSHMHFDHLSLGSLEMIESRVRMLLLPPDGLTYLTDFRFPARELEPWSLWEKDGLSVTAVPVRHAGYRYGIDGAWMTRSRTGWVIAYHGMSVYFPGDTAYDREAFVETRRRFPSIDVALLPIAPIEPRGFMRARHMDPAEALQAMDDLGAHTMVPIHFGTFVNGLDAEGDPPRALIAAARARGTDPSRVALLQIGERRVFIAR